ncbi:hypothetical protein pdul_cds_874 [Pandoravirus dulcis]|uniref:Uncharacterized protein n=1 Tax=Pandoravirus dulcis TaxID=1349409 RepID=S4VUL4_9VIRU|nr:hypothetical protein pdul_cds_874 [Pandoravirus dulcis]AGO83095.1 hypothetical protein pdul_cds_874 [Pandoravirus dulcis]
MSTTCRLTIVERAEDDGRLVKINTGFIVEVNGDDLGRTACIISAAVVEAEAHRSYYMHRRARVPETIVVAAANTDSEAPPMCGLSVDDTAWLACAESAHPSTIRRLFCIVRWRSGVAS